MMCVSKLISLISVAVLLAACRGGDDDRPYSRMGSLTVNDTGVSLCGDYAYGGSNIHNNNVNCRSVGASQTTNATEIPASGSDPVMAGQDAVYGRDVMYPSSADGDLGFNFTKLDRNGVALAIQNGTYSDNGVEASGTYWSCVQDNVTGLVWEMKTQSFSKNIRDKSWTYLWYNADMTNNGGVAGVQDATSGGISHDNCFSATRCDVHKYVVDTNNNYFCGANTWRLPTREELKSLRHLGRGNTRIDSNYFPNVNSAYYWTSSTQAAVPQNAWVVNFADGSDAFADKTENFAVMLVRNK